MAYSSLKIANALLEIGQREGDKNLTPMKLQKLVYFANGWNLGVSQEPLIDEQVEAWQYGPVVPTIYNAARGFGNKPITKPLEKFFSESFESKPDLLTKDERDAVLPLLNWIWVQYGKYDGVQLSNLTHLPGTPWDQTCQQYGRNIPKGTDIDQDIMQRHFEDQYKSLIARQNASA